MLVSTEAACDPRDYWSGQAADVARRLDAGGSGLTSAEASRRLERYGRNELHERAPLTRLAVLGRQVRSPLLLLLVFAAGASAFSGEWVDALIVLTIVLATVGIGYSREYSAQTALEALRTRLRTRTSVIRDGRQVSVPVTEVVPGDLIVLAAGSRCRRMRACWRRPTSS